MTAKRTQRGPADAGDPLAEAAQAYSEAVTAEKAAIRAVEEARRRRADAGKKVEATRGPLAEQISDAARAGVRQREILTRISNVYTRESVRRICRMAGIEPID